MLAEAIKSELGGNRLLATTLANYEQRRNQTARPMYEFIYGLAALTHAQLVNRHTTSLYSKLNVST